MVMSNFDSDTISLDSLLPRDSISLTSSRSSIEYAVPDSKICNVIITDEAKATINTQDSLNVVKYSSPPGRQLHIPNSLKTDLATRDERVTRWISFTGCWKALIDDLAQRYLDEHGCLDSHNIGSHSVGGPIKRRDGSHFIWVQNSIWYTGHQRKQLWSSVQQCGFRMVICLPTSEKAGTLITNFTGKQAVVEEISSALTTSLLEQHAMGQEAMGCVWVLACSIMRAITSQLDLAFHNFDPLDKTYDIPDIRQLPLLLQQANELARVDRYTSGLNEILEFFETVRAFQQSQHSLTPQKCEDGADAIDRHKHKNNLPQKCYSQISERSNLESQFAKQKIRHAQQLCRTYIKQYESHVQMMLSYGTTQIADRLDSGRKLGERVAAVGVVLAAISGLTSPLAVVTGYYGMNVGEFTGDGKSSLFDFWTVALPVIVVSLVGLGVMFARVVLGARQLNDLRMSLRPP